MKAFIKYLLALVFLISSAMKLIDFRNTINFYSGVLDLSFNLARILIVLLILIELMFSLFILFDFIKYNTVFYLIACALIIFTAASVMFWITGINNCGCFGTIITDKPLVSIIKNIFLFAALIVLRKQTVRVKYA